MNSFTEFSLRLSIKLKSHYAWLTNGHNIHGSWLWMRLISVRPTCKPCLTQGRQITQIPEKQALKVVWYFVLHHITVTSPSLLYLCSPDNPATKPYQRWLYHLMGISKVCFHSFIQSVSVVANFICGCK